MIGFEFPLGESYVRRFFIVRRKSSHPDVVIVGKHFGSIDAGEENKKKLFPAVLNCVVFLSLYDVYLKIKIWLLQMMP